MDLVEGRFPKGKHVGKTLEWVWRNDHAYLLWLADNGVMGRTIRDAMESRGWNVSAKPAPVPVVGTSRAPMASASPVAPAQVTPSHVEPVGAWSRNVSMAAPSGRDARLGAELADVLGQLGRAREEVQRLQRERARDRQEREELRLKLVKLAAERDEMARKINNSGAVERQLREARVMLEVARREEASARDEISGLNKERDALLRVAEELRRTAGTSTPGAIVGEAIAKLIQEELEGTSIPTLVALRRWCEDAAVRPKLVLLEGRAVIEKLVSDTLDRLRWEPPEGERVTFRMRVDELRKRSLLTDESAEWVMAVWGIGSKAAHTVLDDGWSQLDAYAMVLIVARVLKRATASRARPT